MPWARFDDHFYNHPKLARLEDLMLPCVGLQTLAICYCSSYLTDGFVPAAMVVRLAGDAQKLLTTGTVETLVEALLEAGMWEKARGGYQIHDYLDYNPSREEVLAERAQRQAAGQAGGQASAAARVKRMPTKGSSKIQAKFNPVPVPVPDVEVVAVVQQDLSLSEETKAPVAQIQFEVPESILEALRKCRILGAADKLRSPAFWQAMVRAHKGIDYASEILEAEAFLTTHPGYSRHGQFLGNWLRTAARRAKEA